jgi:hypothetical protein
MPREFKRLDKILKRVERNDTNKQVIYETLKPLNKEFLYVIPCLLFNEKTKHIFPYRIKFLLPQLCGYGDTYQSTICVYYLGARLQLEMTTMSAKKSFEQILQELDFRPIKQLLNPIENKLLPQADKVLCAAQSPMTNFTAEYDTTSQFTLNLYTNYYQRLYTAYEPGIRDIFRKPVSYLNFQELELPDVCNLLTKCKAPCTLADSLKRKVMLDTLTYGNVFLNRPIADYKYHKEGWSEADQYVAASKLSETQSNPTAGGKLQFFAVIAGIVAVALGILTFYICYSEEPGIWGAVGGVILGVFCSAVGIGVAVLMFIAGDTWNYGNVWDITAQLNVE